MLKIIQMKPLTNVPTVIAPHRMASVPGVLFYLLMAIPLLLGGCKTEFTNARPLRELNPAAAPAGDLYSGWRVFQEKCSGCHGVAATGGDRAPDLLPVVRDLHPRQFAALVLKRYELGGGMAQGSENRSTMETRIEDIVRRSETPMEMPAWQGEPAVNAHILDLYAYLSARADGALGTERPPR